MKKKINYENEVERAAALEANAGLRLKEDAIRGDERFLIFTDEPEVEVEKSLEERVAALEARTLALENPVV